MASYQKNVVYRRICYRSPGSSHQAEPESLGLVCAQPALGYTEEHEYLRSYTVSIKCWHLSPVNHPLVTTGHFHELHNTAACGTLALWDKIWHCVSACASQPCQPLSLLSILLCHTVYLKIPSSIDQNLLVPVLPNNILIRPLSWQEALSSGRLALQVPASLNTTKWASVH